MGFVNILGEYLSYPGLFRKLFTGNKGINADKHVFGAEKNQYILCFTPEKPNSDTAVVYIHGGGWRQGSPNDFRFIGQRFADMGYHAVLTGYRHAPRHKYPAQAEDVFSGLIGYLTLRSSMGNPVKDIIVVGSSAGAHLGALLVYDRSLQEKYGIKRDIFKGFISLSGPLVFEECRGGTIAVLLNGLFPKDYDRKSADPWSLVRGDENVPVLCVHAERDPFLETGNAVGFTDRINSYKPGLAWCHIVKDKSMCHSNLAAGIFLYDNPVAELLYNWIKSLSAKETSA
ncbi:MAG: alpha/beta hydrolase [Clostridiaceae bacterium]|jgi:hypothetical protein|nr:alpha/beta hydrolase [Clostridiaceae bacterium]